MENMQYNIHYTYVRLKRYVLCMECPADAVCEMLCMHVLANPPIDLRIRVYIQTKECCLAQELDTRVLDRLFHAHRAH